MAALTIALSGSSAIAATFLVNTLDVDDDASCDPAPGDCTLPEALDAATATAGGDTISFDPATFPFGDPGIIQPSAALPAATDPAGTVIDGEDARVVIDGQNLAGSEDGLVVQSGAGLPLTGVEIRNVTVRDFPGRGIVVCGGDIADCNQTVTKTIVGHVAVISNDAEGLVVDGSGVSGTRISDTLVSENGDDAVSITASGPITKTRVTRTALVDNLNRGFHIDADSGPLTSTRLDDCAIHRNGDRGINARGDDIVKMQITRLRASDNGVHGVNISSDGDTIGTSIKDTTVSGTTGSAGININADNDTIGTKIAGTQVTNSGSDGILVRAQGQVIGTKITKTVAAENDTDGVDVQGGTGASKTTMVDVTASDNDDNGIELDGTNSKLTKIIATGNADNGILLSDSVTGGDNKLSKIRASSNAGAGIAVAAGNDGNKITKATAYGNGTFDLDDANASCGTNDWSKNAFRTGSEACIQ